MQVAGNIALSTLVLLISSSVVMSAGCADDDNDTDATVDSAPLDAIPIDLTEYFQPCTKSPDSCTAPYACTTTTIDDGTELDVCLSPCEAASDCHRDCVCVGVNGGHTEVPGYYCGCAP